MWAENRPRTDRLTRLGAVTDFALDLPLLHAGKVRRLYALPDGNILMVATDAISAYDHVLATPIPDKGAILNQLSLWWFDQLADVVGNHVVSTDVPAASGAARWSSSGWTWCRSSASPAAT